MSASIVTGDVDDEAFLKQPIRKSVRLPKLLEPEFEFRISSYAQLRDSTHIDSPKYTLNHSAWKLRVTPPEKSEEIGELSLLTISVQNVYEAPVSVSLQGSVWGLSDPEDSISDVSEATDKTMAVDDAFHLPITKFKVDGKADFLCQGISYEMLKETTTLGISISVHVYGEPEVVDHSAIIASNFPQLSFREFTLGRDLGGILTMSAHRGKHMPDGLGADDLSPDSPITGGGGMSASASTSAAMASASNVPPNLVLHDKTFSDVTLVAAAGDERMEIYAHKCVLAARSPVFRKKFSRPMSSFQMAFTGGRYHFAEAHPSVVRELICFVYTDSVAPLALAQHSVPLLITAARYQVEGLVHACERYLIENMTPDVAASYLVIATDHRLKELETAASYYIASHIDDVRAQDYKWGELSANQCRMLLELSSQSNLLWNWTAYMWPTNHIPAPISKEEEKDGYGTPSKGDYLSPSGMIAG